jgi:hypothetical protein
MQKIFPSLTLISARTNTIIVDTPQNPAMPTPPTEYETKPTTRTSQDDNIPTMPTNAVSPVVENDKYLILTPQSPSQIKRRHNPQHRRKYHAS